MRRFFLFEKFLVRSCAPLRESFFYISHRSFHCRAIPQAGYIRIGALRYGIRVSSLNLSDYSQSTNKSQTLSPSTDSSLIMSPSSDTINPKTICDDECCCCIGSIGSSKTRVPVSQLGENDLGNHWRILNFFPLCEIIFFCLYRRCLLITALNTNQLNNIDVQRKSFEHKRTI